MNWRRLGMIALAVGGIWLQGYRSGHERGVRANEAARGSSLMVQCLDAAERTLAEVQRVDSMLVWSYSQLGRSDEERDVGAQRRRAQDHDQPGG